MDANVDQQMDGKPDPIYSLSTYRSRNAKYGQICAVNNKDVEEQLNNCLYFGDLNLVSRSACERGGG